MEEIQDEIVRLLEEHEKLLKDKESNRLQIWICEQEIYTYTHLYDTLSQLSVIKKKNIESYLDLIDYKKNNACFAWPGLVPGYSHILPMIDNLQDEYDKLYSQANDSKKLIQLYSTKKKALESKNDEIDERLEVIEKSLDTKDTFVKRLKMDKGV